jgi:hypothetical protein
MTHEVKLGHIQTIGTMAGGTQNCANQLGYYPDYFRTYHAPEANFPFKARKVEGGWVVIVNGKEHVCTEAEQITVLLKESFK